MKILAINGSPRKNHNTATLLNQTLAGAASQGAETEQVNLYDLTYKGCVSCFACKLKNGKSYGKCAYKDDLSPLLEKIETVDAIILGSPIYLMSVTGYMRAFMERLIFPYLTYTENYKSLFEKKIPAAMIYTMNITDEQMQTFGLRQVLELQERYIEKMFGSVEQLIVNDTYQFDDYSKYDITVFDEDKKAKIKEEQFPLACKKAFDLGVRFAQAQDKSF